MNYAALLTAISDAHQQAQAGAAGAVNRHLILRNWLIGAYLVEFEQSGEDRAEYGTRLIQRVASDLKSRDIGGLGASMLKDCRTFYRLYPQIRQPAVGGFPGGDLLPIRQPLIGESAATGNSAPAVRNLDAATTPRPLPAAGLLLCTDKNQTKVEYATGGLDHQLFVSRYLVALPQPGQLQQLIETDRAVWEQRHPQA